MRARLHGIDLSPERVTAARARVPDAQLAAGDMRRLPYDAGRFDVVTVFTVLSSIGGRVDVQWALGEARRVLADDGVALVWEPRVPNPLNRDTRVIGRRELAAAFPERTLQSVTTTVVPALARRLGRATPWLYPRLSRIGMLRTHRLVRASGSRSASGAITPS